MALPAAIPAAAAKLKAIDQKLKIAAKIGDAFGLGTSRKYKSTKKKLIIGGLIGAAVAVMLSLYLIFLPVLILLMVPAALGGLGLSGCPGATMTAAYPNPGAVVSPGAAGPGGAGGTQTPGSGTTPTPDPSAVQQAQAIEKATGGQWRPDQLSNAITIAQEALKEFGPTLGAKAAVVGIATGITESGLHNLPYGDRDSVGVFQQRPSQGWGSASQILSSVQYQAQQFYQHLKQVPNWQNLPVQLAAQAVQRSAFSDGSNYAPNVSPAARLVAAILPGVSTGALQGCGNPNTAGGNKPGNPLSCMPVLTQPYGPSPYSIEPALNGYPHFHSGIDLACAAGTPVHTLTDGVAHVTMGYGGGYGNNVVVQVQTKLPGDQAPRMYFVRYAHLQTVSVADGAQVTANQQIGTEGSTGNSTGPHLHTEIDVGTPSDTASINPSPLVQA